jgi:replicative DNA helicase
MGRRRPIDGIKVAHRGSASGHSQRSGRHTGSAAQPRFGETPLDDPTNPEILLISAVVQTGDFAEASTAGVTSEHFHSHRLEWDWLSDFALRFGKCPDKATFKAQFPDFPLLRTTDVGYGAEVVQRAHLRYTLTGALREATGHLVSDDPERALALMHSAMTGINHTNGTRELHADVLREFSPVLAEAERRQQAASSLGYAGISYGFPTLDARTGGMQPGDLAIWAARLGQGKTWFLVKIATEALLAGKKVVFVSLEQSRAQIVFRVHTILARELGYSLRHLDLMQGTNVDLDWYRSFLVELPTRVPGELIVSDPSLGKVNPFTLASLMDRHDPDLLIVDYMTLMSHDGDDWRGARNLSRETKLVAAQYGVPILAAAQINRAGEGGKRPPGTDKLSESDGIGQDADVVITHKQESESVVQGLLAKNRSGQSNQVFWAAFQPNEGRFEEIQHDEALTLISLDGFDDD